MEDNQLITFDQSVRDDMLSAFGKKVDGEGFIVEADDESKKVLTPKGEEISSDEWGGVTRGSEAFVKSDAFSLIELARKL